MNFRQSSYLRNSKQVRSQLEHCWLLATDNRAVPPEKPNRICWMSRLSIGITAGLCIATFYLMGIAVLAVAEDMMQASHPTQLGYPSHWRF